MMKTFRIDTGARTWAMLDAWRMPVGYFGTVFGLAIVYEKFVGSVGLNVPMVEMWMYFVGAIVAVGLLRTLNAHAWARRYEFQIDAEKSSLSINGESRSLDDVHTIVALPGGTYRLETSTDSEDIVIPRHLEDAGELREILSSWRSIDDRTSGFAALKEVASSYGAWIPVILLPFIIGFLLEMT